MADYTDEGTDQMNLLRYMPSDESADRIDAMWRQIMVYKAFSDSELSEARSRRIDAEADREKAEQEASSATKLLYEGMRSEANHELDEAKVLKAEAARVLQKAESERGRAKDALKEAEQARDRIMVEAQRRAQDMVDDARKVAQQESTALRHQALKEIKAILARAESFRAATDEELETQRILSDIARIKAGTANVTNQGAAGDDGPAEHDVQESESAPADAVESTLDVAPAAPLAPVTSQANGKSSAARSTKSEAALPKASKAKDKKTA